MAENSTSTTINQVKVNLKSESERALIIRTFKGNEWLLKEMRELFLGRDVSEEGRKAISEFTPELKSLIRQRFLPEMSKEDNIAILSDIWSSIDERITGQHPDTIRQIVSAQERAIELSKIALDLLDNLDGPRPDISHQAGNFISDPLQVTLLGRNQFMRLVSGQLFALYSIANEEKKTPGQLAKAAAMDSAA